jgi:hypothetical protein
MIDQYLIAKDNFFEKAYDRLLTEFQIVLETSAEEAQKKLDKALKRNTELQKSKIENQININQETENRGLASKESEVIQK